MVIILGRARFQLGPPLATGGSGAFHAHPTKPNVGIKTYLKPEEAEPLRIDWLCSNPPPNLLEDRVITHCWPQEPVYDEATGDMIGFSLPRVHGTQPVMEFVNPSARKIAVDRRWLWKLAHSVAKRVHTLHLMSPPHVVGDINFFNFLVHRAGLVTQIDLDSTHFTIPNGTVFTCGRCRPELQPPELVSAQGPILNRDQDQDAWSVYTAIHRVLREGLHPFDATYHGSGTPPRLHERIEQGIWPHSLRHPEYKPVDGAVPFASLPHDMQELFRQMFDEGLRDRTKRPTVTDLLSCLETHQPAGTHFATIARCDWARAFGAVRKKRCPTVNQIKARLSKTAVFLGAAAIGVAALAQLSSLTDSQTQESISPLFEEPFIASPLPTVQPPDSRTERAAPPAASSSSERSVPKLWQRATGEE